MSAHFRLLVGLGNPTSQYEKTRHNAGFWFVDALADRHHLEFHREPRFQGVVSRLESGTASVYLLKPMTYMNRSGQAVAAMANYYRIDPAEILVAHDELDFPPGVVRLKFGGGHGGHNGLRDVLACLGSAEFYRLRFGIGRPDHPDGVAPFVLSNPRSQEQELMRGAIDRAAAQVPDMLAGDLARVMTRLNSDSKAKARNGC